MATAQVLAVLVPIVIVGMLGWMGDEDVHIRSLYFPLAFVYFAFRMAFDVTNQTVTAVRSGRGEHDVAATLLSAGVLWLACGGAFGGVLSATAPALADLLGATRDTRAEFVSFLRAVSAANLTLAFPVLCASAMRGAGRAGRAAVVMIVSNVTEVGALAALGFGAGLGAAALPLAATLNGLVGGALGIVLLARAGVLKEWGWQPEVPRRLLRAGLPVGLTNLIMFGMNFGFVMMLKPFGPDVLAGFATGTTVQSLVLMPGTVLGSAAAIVMNRRAGADPCSPLSPVLGAALRMSLAVYAATVPALWLLRGAIGHLTARSDAIAGETARFIAIVGPSYLVLGLVLTVLVALQQVGAARVALTASIVYAVGTVTAGWLAGRVSSGPVLLYAVMAAMNTVGLVLVAAALVLVRARDRRGADR